MIPTSKIFNLRLNKSKYLDVLWFRFKLQFFRAVSLQLIKILWSTPSPKSLIDSLIKDLSVESDQDLWLVWWNSNQSGYITVEVLIGVNISMESSQMFQDSRYIFIKQPYPLPIVMVSDCDLLTHFRYKWLLYYVQMSGISFDLIILASYWYKSWCVSLDAPLW